jgi:hypothetical protein
MRSTILFLLMITAFLGCQPDSNSVKNKPGTGQHMAVVVEVLQTTQYTYLKVKEDDKESWLALPKMEAEAGQTYYYKDGLKMTEFASKELNRTFPEVLFLDKISSTPIPTEMNSTAPAELASGAQPSIDTASERSQVETHVMVADEVLQTTQYTYIHGKDGDKELWVAVNRMDASVGTKYYFIGGLPMADFKSKELNRTFKEVLFADNISTSLQNTDPNTPIVTQNSKVVSTGSAIPLEKQEVKVSHGKGELTIAQLFANKKEYSGKIVKLKGKVTKFTGGIMKKNWIHLQDGTENSGKFDLVVTTSQEVKVDDLISVEGVISTEKDFGFGYYYDVIMEDAKVSK